MVSQNLNRYARAERRIGWLTLALGLAAAAITGAVGPSAAGLGVAIGAVLAWLNYRWLHQAAVALSRLAAAGEGSRPHISTWVYVKFFARYGLIGVVLYVMVTRFAVPVVSMLAGLCALGAAAMAESIYELLVRPD